ncbi:MAG: phenylalanine--tRNA ligase subunit beta [Euryarchaeota archaeon]|nr:phenylalanine--tRNA ligase subunit beta [Euryarchaeota archaeon]
MPVVDIAPDELRELAGTDKSDDQLKDDLFGLGLEYEGETEEGEFQFEFAPDRLDRLSVEGVARSLRYHYGEERGTYVPPTNAPDWTIEVDESVPEERPYVTGAVIRGLDLDESGLDSLIQLQEKLHATMGRKRAKGAIGIHDLTMLKARSATGGESPTIRYTGVSPDEDRFVPLDSDAELTPGEVLEEHPTGREYADLVSAYERYPAIYDELGLFSFPPVINGRRTEVSTGSRELFVELTGTDQWTIDRMCAIICYALSARGATIEEVEIEYPDRELVRPDFEVHEKRVSHDRIERMLGMAFEPKTLIDCFERSGLSATQLLGDEAAYDVEIPPYRVDVLHPVDLIDDVGRAYGFDSLIPTYPDVSTVGGRHERTRLEDAARNVLVGLGFEDQLTFQLTNETETFERMRIDSGEELVGAGEPATIREPYSEDYTIVRTWALPSLMMVLENNTHRSYPQNLAEIGLATEIDDSTETGVAERRTVAGVLARTDASYEDAKGVLQAIARTFGVDLETPAADHSTFIDGRAAAVVIDGRSVGIVGEIHPAVLVEHDLEIPVSAFEFRLDALE